VINLGGGEGSEVLGAGYAIEFVDGCVLHIRPSSVVCLYLVFCFVNNA
jgi:hypothetical protein